MQDLDLFSAEQDWRNARRKVLYQDVVCLIKRCSVDLLSFNEVQEKQHLMQQNYIGLQVVPIENIRGSVGRFDDFNSAFLPKKDHMQGRWQKVEVAMLEGKTPPVDLYQVGDDYYVLDGNHRVSVSRQRGMDTIEAYVTKFAPQGHSDDTERVDDVFIETERLAFLEKSGRSNAADAEAMVFTCPGCYEVVTKQIDDYRQGVAEKEERSISFAEAFSEWNDEVYAPSVAVIRKDDLISKFPDRTEADLFVWTSQNSTELEDLEKNK